MQKIVSGITLALLIIGMLSLAFNIPPVEANGNIYIRSDGSIDPPTAPIKRVGNTYIFMSNINGSIVVERNNITVDGAGYTLQGNGSGNGISICGGRNVVIKNFNIRYFHTGIYVVGKYKVYTEPPANNTICENDITNNKIGILLDFSPANFLRNNRMINNDRNLVVSALYRQYIDTSNTVNGKPIYYWIDQRDKVVPPDAGYVALVGCKNIKVQGLNLSNNGAGLLLVDITDSIIAGNTFINNNVGIYLQNSSRNIIIGNTVLLNSGYGVEITLYSKQNTVSGNKILGNGHGIYVNDFSTNNIIINNTVTLNEGYGIHLNFYSDNCTLTENYVAGSTTGIRVHRSINNVLRKNKMVNNKYNFQVWYFFVSQPFNDIDISNTVDGKPIYHWIGERDKTIPNDAGFVALINCVKITVKNLNLANNKDGILLISTRDSIIIGNTITKCISGLYLVNSSYNTIVRNNIINNSIGVTIEESEYNKFYHNNFLNQRNVDIVGFFGFQHEIPVPANIWDNGYPSGGNYWSDYSGTDANDDGIGDRPYVIFENNQDNYPLMYPTPPTISIISPENKTYSLREVPLTFIVRGSILWMGYSLDGQSNVTITGNTTLSGLSEGHHSLTVYAKDRYGNTGASEKIYFTIEVVSEHTPQTEPFPITMIVMGVIAIGIAITLGAVIYKRKGKTNTSPALFKF